MNCDEIENLIPEYLEKQLDPAAQSRVAAHLAGCAVCREFARQLEQLDAALARTVKAPTLSPEFQSRLQQRIQSLPSASKAEIAARKCQLQAEYESRLAQFRLLHLSTRQLSQALGGVTLLVMAGWLGWQWLPQLMQYLARQTPAGLDQNLPMAFTAGLLLLAMGFVGTAFQRQLKRAFLAA
jgi:anti-sigma factor RsiW